MPRRSIVSSISRFFRKHREKRHVYKKLHHGDYLFSIKSTRLLSSRGIIENCDIHDDAPQSSAISEQYVRSIPLRVAGVSKTHASISIYLCTDSINLFIGETLSRIDQPFILVTGDSDLCVNQHTIPDIDKLLSSTHMITWFAQNLEYQHPKTDFLPIGLDYHSGWQDPRHYGTSNILPLAQEAELRSVCCYATTFSQRKPLVVCDWFGRSSYGDREEARLHIPDDVRIVPKDRLPRHQLWQLYAEHAFVASPFGIGLDCHRTWEAIALGCVPIIKRSLMSSLFDGMPVLIIEDWSQLSVEYLKERHKEFSATRYNYSKFLLNTWRRRIKGDEAKSELVLSIDQANYLI